MNARLAPLLLLLGASALAAPPAREEMRTDLEEFYWRDDRRGERDPYLEFAYEHAHEEHPGLARDLDVPRLYEYEDPSLYPNRYRYFVRLWNSGELYRNHPFALFSHVVRALDVMKKDVAAKGGLSERAVTRDLIDIVQFANRNWDLPVYADRTVGDILGPRLEALKKSEALAARIAPYEAPEGLRGSVIKSWPARNGWKWLPVYHRVIALFGRETLERMLKEWGGSKRLSDWEFDGGHLYYALIHRAWAAYVVPDVKLQGELRERLPKGAGGVEALAWLSYMLNQSKPPKSGLDRHGFDRKAVSEFLALNKDVVLLRDDGSAATLTVGDVFLDEKARLCGPAGDFPAADRPRGRAYKGPMLEAAEPSFAGLRGSGCASSVPAPWPPEPGPSSARMDWVSIPGGEFMMGSDDGDPDEGPRHRVSVPAFEMARTEVTFGQYKRCVEAGACAKPDCESPDDEHPVVCVDSERAKAFSRWVGGRLPSEAEWEYAARGGGKERRYPWGDAEPTCERAVVRSCGGRQSARPVCSKPAGRTPQGLCDMAGNVWEWTLDRYCDDYAGAPADGSARADCKGRDLVMRGGAWNYEGEYARVTFRSGDDPTHRFTNIGFRPVRAPAR